VGWVAESRGIGIFRGSRYFQCAGGRHHPILGLANVYDPEFNGWDGTSSTAEALINWRTAVKNSGLEKRKKTHDEENLSPAEETARTYNRRPTPHRTAASATTSEHRRNAEADHWSGGARYAG